MSEKHPSGSRFEDLEAILAKILEEMEQLSTSNLDLGQPPKQEYVSCLKIKGKPILPPLMTPERRLECLQLKRKALEVEAKLAERRRQKLLDALEASRSEEDQLDLDASRREDQLDLDASRREDQLDLDASRREDQLDFEASRKEDPQDLEDTRSEDQYELEATRSEYQLEQDLDSGFHGAEDNRELLIQSTERFADERVKSAFKKIVSKLKKDAQAHNQVDLTSPHCDSLSSEPTIIENSPGVGAQEDEDVGDELSTPSPVRERRGSYTLDHPSPVLLAYMTRIGKTVTTMESPRPRSFSSSQPASRTNEEYLSEVSTKQIEPSAADKIELLPSSSSEHVILNPPTPFANTPIQHDTEEPSGLEPRDARKIQIDLFQDSDSDNDYSTQMEPLSVISRHATPSISSAIQSTFTPEPSQKTFPPKSRSDLTPSNLKSPSALTDRKSIVPSHQDSANQDQTCPDLRQPDLPRFPANFNPNQPTILEKQQLKSLANSVASSKEPKASVVPHDPLLQMQQLKNFQTSTNSQIPSISVEPPLSARSGHDYERPHSVASSLQNSMSIKLPEDLSHNAMDGQRLQSAISSLAIRQQAEIQRLLDQQTKEREELKRLFEAQQKQLVQEILQQVCSVSRDRTSSDSTLRPATSSTPPRKSSLSIGRTSQMSGRTSPIIPTLAAKVRPPEEKLKELPPNFRVPQLALTPQMKCRFDKLSALVKGHLTRRLLRTERVQRIISSMRDTMTIALQLHREAKSSQGRSCLVSVQDIELHRRLLQQIFKDAQSIHNIFFEIPTPQRISIIRQDREIRHERALRGEDSTPPSRLSAVTKARMQQRRQIQAMLIKSEAALKSPRQHKHVTRSQERPWRQKPNRDSPYRVKSARSSGRSSASSVRRSLNLNENQTSRKISPPIHKSRMARSLSSASALTVIHNKPWK